MWIVFTLIAGIFTTLQMLLSRQVLKEGKDAWAYSFWYSFTGAVVCLPFVLFTPTIPTTITPWLLVVLVGVIIVLHNILVFKSMNHLEASVGGALLKFRLVWVFVLGAVLYQETVSMFKIIGTLFTILAGFVVVQKFRQPEKRTAVYLVLGATVLNALIIILYKYLFLSFNVITMTFLVFFIPMIINVLIMPNAFERIKKILLTDRRLVLVSTAMGGFANLAINQGFLLGEVSRVTVVSEAFLIVMLFFEHRYFNERRYMKVKLLSVILAVIGALLMVL